MGGSTCVHGAEGARIENGRLFAPWCERCTDDRKAREDRERLEAIWKLPAYGEEAPQKGYQGYLELMPEE